MSFLAGQKVQAPQHSPILAEADRRAGQLAAQRQGRGATLLTGPGLGDVQPTVARPLVQGV